MLQSIGRDLCPPDSGLANVRAYLALGSNLGDRWQFLREAVGALEEEVVGVSHVYETDPVGGPSGQGAYLNCVVGLETAKTPHELLGVCRRLESAANRVRQERDGPRTLDVDVLLVGDLKVHDADLTIPHPRMWERWFVLAPLSDLAPELVTQERPPRLRYSVRDIGPLFPTLPFVAAASAQS